MTERIDLRLNGEATTLEAGLTIAAWLESLDRDPRTVAIERNGTIVPRSEYGHTPLEAGDELEVVHFVQGG